MKKQGFTLIELLAVIVILAIIALIAIPIIFGIITDAKKEAFRDTVYGIIDSAKFYASKHQLKENKFTGEIFTFPTEELKFEGEMPTGGTLQITAEGKTKVDRITNGTYCAYKDFNESKVRIENCNEEDIPQPVVADEHHWVTDGNGTLLYYLTDNIIFQMFDFETAVSNAASTCGIDFENMSEEEIKQKFSCVSEKMERPKVSSELLKEVDYYYDNLYTIMFGTEDEFNAIDWSKMPTLAIISGMDGSPQRGECRETESQHELQSIDDFVIPSVVVHDDGTEEVITKIGQDAFRNRYGCVSINNGAVQPYLTGRLVIPKTITEIGTYAFEGQYINELVFEEGSNLQHIKWGAFQKNAYLTNVNLPSSLVRISSLAFYKNENINVNIDSNTVQLGNCIAGESGYVGDVYQNYGGKFNNELPLTIIDITDETYKKPATFYCDIFYDSECNDCSTYQAEFRAFAKQQTELDEKEMQQQ